MRKKKRHNPPPISSQPYKAPEPLPSSFKLVVDGPNQAIGICRFIATRYRRGDSPFTQEDFLLMWLLVEYLQRFRYTNIYKEKEFFFSLCILMLKDMVHLQKGSAGIPRATRLSGFTLELELDPRAYLGRLHDNSYDANKFIRLVNPNKMRKEKTRRFVGVGYRDKGHTVLHSQDGSPQWKELSRDLSDYDVETYYLRKKYYNDDWPAYLIPPEVNERVSKLPPQIFAELELIHSPASPRPFHGWYFEHNGERLIRKSFEKAPLITFR